MKAHPVYVGTAGWAIPASFASLFPPPPRSHLERYAAVFRGVEINSSFYRDHRPKTYARWAATVPDEFRFSVKLTREFTHRRRLDVGEAELRANLDPIGGLGEKFGVLLVQLPPSLGFSPIAARFLGALRKIRVGAIAIEPRHASWTSPASGKTLRDLGISKVVADPERCPIDDFTVQTAGGFGYFRLHGSPEIYRSEYSVETAREMAETIALASRRMPIWCIFDNTTFGYATRDARRVEEIRTDVARANGIPLSV